VIYPDYFFMPKIFFPGYRPPAASTPRRLPPGKVPKKPGNIPPFALFVQDHRPGILEENRDIRFLKLAFSPNVLL
jgi:hypothetical protein